MATEDLDGPWPDPVVQGIHPHVWQPWGAPFPRVESILNTATGHAQITVIWWHSRKCPGCGAQHFAPIEGPPKLQ